MARLTRSPEGILEVVLHTDGDTLVFDGYTHEEFVDLFHRIGDDADNRVVILTGAGDKAFIAGADISELAHVDAYEAEESSRFGQSVLDMIENLGKPVIAAINGFALGGGCETAMACTIRLAEEHASFGRGIGYVDAHLLAATKLTTGASLWTRDKRLRQVADRLSLAASVST